MLEVQQEKYLEEVHAFAARTGQTKNLEEGLAYLDTYGERERGDTQCLLFQDSAPYSFRFTMLRRIRMRKHHCEHRHTWTEKVKLSESTPNISGEATAYCPYCGKRATASEPSYGYEPWFFGGLIYHGPHDGYGSGSAPTFAVTLSPTDGWSVHT